MPLPRYVQIADDLREQIRTGVVADGTRLSGERVLMTRYGVQRNTVRQAIILLQNEGWLVVRPRSGAFVVAKPGDTASSTVNETSESGTVLVINAWNRSSTALDRILLGLGQALEFTGYTIQRFNSAPQPNTGFHVLPSAAYLQSNHVVGAILWPQSSTDVSAVIALRNQIPLILVDRRVIGLESDCIRSNDEAGGYLLTQHLIAQGHRRIGFLGDEAFAETVQQRWRGYARAHQEAQIAFDQVQFAAFAGIASANERMYAGYVRTFLDAGGDPLTAVVCSNDLNALLLLRFLRREGVRVPEDIAITGYGNLLPAYMDTLDLTTVNQPFEEVGRSAGALIRERIASGGVSVAAFRHVELPVELIVRNSTAAPLRQANAVPL